VSPFNRVQPGDTVRIEAGQREFLLIRNFSGDSLLPVVFINEGGQVQINTSHYYGMSVRNCRYVHFTGTGDTTIRYGISISKVENGGGIGFGDKSSDIEMDHFSITHCKGVGISAKTDPDCTNGVSRSSFTQFNTIIHDNYIAHVSYEAMYIGSTKYFGQVLHCTSDTLVLPPLLEGVLIYNNVISNTGWDGIQVSSAGKRCKVFGNIIENDSQEGFYNQMSGISLGGGSKCDCYNNLIFNGKGNGIEMHGLGGNHIFNNVIINAGRTYLPGNFNEMRHGIYVSDVSMDQDSAVNISHNTIVSPKSDGIRFASILSRHNLLVSNLIINPGNYDFYENGGTNFDGNDSYIMLPNLNTDAIIQNNYFTRNAEQAGVDSVLFIPVEHSPLIDAAYPQPGIAFDFYNHLRPLGNAPDIGAFEFDKSAQSITNEPLTRLSPVLYPNPANDYIHIQFSDQVNDLIRFEIFSIQGDSVLSAVSAPGMKNNVVSVNISQLSTGLYCYRIIARNQIFTGKFIKY
jgi:hypothetical protein